MRNAAPRWLRGSRLRVLASALVAAALAGATGLAADASSASAPPAVRVHLAYGCRFPSGTYQVSVTLAGTFPSTAIAGQPTKTSGLRTTVVLPRSAIAGLHKLGATAVTGSSVLAAAVVDNTKVLAVSWPGRLRKPASIAGTGGVHLTFSVAVPPVTVNAPGTVTFTAASLTLALAPLRKADTGQVNQPILRAACTLSPGQDAKLAVIPAVDAGPAPATPGARGIGAPRSAADRAVIPKGCGSVGVKSPQISCGYITGYANVNKLGGSALLQPAKPQNPGLASIAENVKTKVVHNGVLLINIGKLYYRGHEELPPIQTTFLGFRFVPIKATLQIIELKPIVIQVLLYDITLVKITATTEVSFHILNATVNGVPWNGLGSHCQTKTPIQLKVVGRGNTANGGSGFFNLAAGGTLGGFVNVPYFTGCGVGQNLDSLFNASISGSGNFDLMTQGALCLYKPFFANTCPPLVPTPKRHLDTGKPLH